MAVQLRRNVKDALIQYRSICQQTNVASLDKVLRHYRQLAASKTTAAEAQATSAGVKLAEEEQSGGAATASTSTAIGGDDEEEESPESLLMMAMSGEGVKERSERQILLPWVRYQWESCRTILDVLRNNVRLERLYHEVARSSFQFCLKFSRKVEFRKLCEIMRTHLVNVAKYQGQSTSVDLSNPDTQLLYLETRFQQLEAAATLELWQEAYRTIEDIYENMRQSHVLTEHNPLMKTYYEKLADIFWASSNFLFHAYSLDKFLILSIADEATTEEHKHYLANSTVLASLIVSGSQVEEEVFTHRHEGAARLAQLLGFKKETPSRAKLLQLLLSQGILNECSDVVVSIFDLLENRFLPLSLTAELAPLLEQLKSDEKLSRYVLPLQNLVIIRVLQQLSTVFKSIKVDKFLSLIPSTSTPHGLVSIERLMMQAISSEHLIVRIDHQNQLLLFPDDDLESARMRDQLVHLSRELGGLADRIEPVNVSAKLKERQHVFSLISQGVSTEHESVYKRQEEIEKRKQESERQAVEKEKREAELKATAAKERKAEEARRLEEESRKREQERLKKEAEEKDLAAKQALAQEINRKVEGVAGKMSKGIAVKAAKKMKELTADLEKIDRAALLAAQEAVLEQERKENERRRRESVRRMDYFTRACRMEEREVLIATAEKKKMDDKAQLEADFERYVEEHRKLHEKALQEKERLTKMKVEKEEFFAKLIERRKEVQAEERAKQMVRFEAKRKEHEREEKRKREEERAKEREKEKRATEERERLEKEAQKLRLQEDERRKKEEDRARREQERLDIIEKERRREEEFERKERERRAGERVPIRREEPRGERREERREDRREDRRDERREEPAADKWRRGGEVPVRAEEGRPRVDEGAAAARKEEDARQWRRQEEAAEAERVATRAREHKEEKEWRRQQPSSSGDEIAQQDAAAVEAGIPLDDETLERQRRFGALQPGREPRAERDAPPPADNDRFGGLRSARGDRDRPAESRADRPDDRWGGQRGGGDRDRDRGERERPSEGRTEGAGGRFERGPAGAPGGPPVRFSRGEEDNRGGADRPVERRGAAGGGVGDRKPEDRQREGGNEQWGRRDDRDREDRADRGGDRGDRMDRDRGDRGDRGGTTPRDSRGGSGPVRRDDSGGQRDRRPGGGADRPIERAAPGGQDDRFSRDRGDSRGGAGGGGGGDRGSRDRDGGRSEEGPRKPRDFADVRKADSPQQ